MLVSLIVVMGLTWISGLFVMELEELVPLAYIHTIMVAFQGLFIFLIFVAYPKEVRDAYAKLLWIKKSDRHHATERTNEVNLLRIAN